MRKSKPAVNWDAAWAIALAMLMALNAARFYEDGSTRGAAVSAVVAIAFAVRSGTSRLPEQEEQG